MPAFNVGNFADWLQTRRIQNKRAKAARKAEAGPSQPPVSELLAAQRERARNARAARKARTVEMKKGEAA